MPSRPAPWRPIGLVFLPFAAGYYLTYLFRTINAVIASRLMADLGLAAAALPGAIASLTIRPVIGVPVALKSKIMGIDSLLSMVQMPPGIPVATVGLDGGRNAALLAAGILALSEENQKKKLKGYRDRQRNKVIEKDTAFKEE